MKQYSSMDRWLMANEDPPMAIDVRDHPPITPRAVAAAAWHLYAVGSVKDHRPAEILHQRNRAHIAY